MINKTIYDVLDGWEDKTDDYDFEELLNDLETIMDPRKEDTAENGYIEAILVLLLKREEAYGIIKRIIEYSIALLMDSLYEATYT